MPTELKVVPRRALENGAKLLQPLLSVDGFRFKVIEVGAGSGGEYARGQFVNGDRCLDLHFGYSLGMVSYSVSEHTLSHEDYMRSLGVYGRHRYPGFAEDPLQAFRDLASDIEEFAQDWLLGDGKQFVRFAEELKTNPKKFSNLPR
jgi:hypothetical protein